MKNYIKFILCILAVFVFTAFFTLLKAQGPTVTINYQVKNLIPGTIIHVPVVMNATQVGNWQILINYDREVLTYISTDNTVGGLGLFNVMDNYMGLGYQVFKAGLAYTGGSPGYNYSNQTILTINFTYKGGGTSFPYTNISTLITQTGPTFTYVKTYPSNTINLSTVFNTGYASGILHSITAGGQWKNRSTWTENVKPNALCDIQITGDEVLVDSAAACSNLTIENGAILKLNQGINLNVNGNFLLKSEIPSASLQDPGNGVNLKGDRNREE